ncbi:MAG: mechanosensitive ion channel family protein, partial [Acidimicrobiaceae bacterium]|nr:mechanosensitive ion channel family protein [Acidimicrobiaceae bacterium]
CCRISTTSITLNVLLANLFLRHKRRRAVSEDPVRDYLIEGVLNYLIGTHPTLRDSVIVSRETHTGTVDRMSLTYTTLVTDEGRQIFGPNLMMVRNVITNHSHCNRRRAVSVRLPVAMDAAIDDARHVAFKSERAVEEEANQDLELHVNLVARPRRVVVGLALRTRVGQWLHARNRLLDAARPIDALGEYEQVREAAQSFVHRSYV